MRESVTSDIRETCTRMQGIFKYPNFKRTHVEGILRTMWMKPTGVIEALRLLPFKEHGKIILWS